MFFYIILSFKLAKVTNEYAASLMRFEKYDLAETTLLKNKQIIEPIAEKTVWENKFDWQFMRISIILNLIIIFQKLNKPLRLYQLLKGFFQHIRVDILFENPQSFEKELETLFISMAICCFSFKKYEEAQIYANDGIKLLRKILRNDALLTTIRNYFKEKNYNFEKFINKKNISLAKLMNLLGKITEKLQLQEESVNNYYQAYNLMKIFQGEENPMTLTYKQDLARVKDSSLFFVKNSGTKSPIKKHKSEMNFADNYNSDFKETSMKKSPIKRKSITFHEKNVYFGSLSPENEKNQRKTCFSVHIVGKNETQEKKNVKKQSKRPFSANAKIIKKESLSEYLVKSKIGSLEKSPDFFKIKIFYPENNAKSRINAEKKLNQCINIDFQSARIINSLQFDKSSLKTILKSHKISQRSNETSTKLFFLDSNDSKIMKNSKYSSILTPRPVSTIKSNDKKISKIIIPTTITHRIITVNNYEEIHLSSQKTEKSIEEIPQDQPLNINIQTKESPEENEFRIGNSPKNQRKRSTFYEKTPYSPMRKSAKRNSFMNNENLPLKRKSLLRNDFKLNINEINKTTPRNIALCSDKNVSLNRRIHIDSGIFTKQRKDFLRPTTPLPNPNKETIYHKLESKILSQKELFLYYENLDKIKLIQTFWKESLKKKGKLKIPFFVSSSQMLETKNSNAESNEKNHFFLKNFAFFSLFFRIKI